MRLYQFKNADGSIDVTVTTDGSKSQQRVFIAATPSGKGYKVSGSMKEDDGAIQKLGFNFVCGTMRHHQDFVNFATTAGLTLTQWNGGLDKEPIIIVPEGGLFSYVLTVVPPINFLKAGETRALTIVSTKQKIVGGVAGGAATSTPTTVTITEGQATFSAAGSSITAKVNAGATVVKGKAVVTQTESGKTVEVILTQLGV